MSEQFSLCWDNFYKNMSSGMQSLLETEDLVDVTLAVEGRLIKAHKMVLSVCSPYFRELFQSNPCQHPIVFMKDVSYIALSDLLQFMYQGEVQVAQENLSTFIKTAEALQIKGLTADGVPDSEEQEIEMEKPKVESTVKSTPASRVRKLAGPASKRPKYSIPSTDTTPTKVVASVSTLSAVNKSEPSNNSTSEATLFNVDLESTNRLHAELDDSQTGEYEDETALDETQEEGDDYSLMETTDEEPKAGTSADGFGEGQDFYHGDIKFENNIIPKYKNQPPRRKADMARFIVDGFVFHVNIKKGKPPMTYLRCLEYKRLGCHARAIIPHNGSIHDIQMKKSHNHPPDFTAEEKIVFLRELKEVVMLNTSQSVRDIYTELSMAYPNAAREMPFPYIRHKMNRWRRNNSVQIDEYMCTTFA